LKRPKRLSSASKIWSPLIWTGWRESSGKAFGPDQPGENGPSTHHMCSHQPPELFCVTLGDVT
jgi:hypothetical protein